MHISGRLAYGSAGAAPAALPVETLVPGFGANPDVLAHVGTARSQAALASGHPERLRPAADWKRILLWLVLVSGVALLAWMAWLSRQLANAPVEPAPESSAAKSAADSAGKSV